MIDKYPEVLGEMDTLDLVCSGRSIARYGDGEFKIAMGGAAKAQAADRDLTRRLAGILHDSGECLVGIPNIKEVVRSHTVDQKVLFWSRFMATRMLLSDRPYVSAFITRPDSAPWIDTPAYWEKVQSLWIGQDVTLVRGSTKSLVADDLDGAGSVTELVVGSDKLKPNGKTWFRDAFADYDATLKRILSVKPKRAILCLGPTATVLAVDLCKKGIHAIDAGHIGMFLRKHRDGSPMWLAKDEAEHTVA